MSVIPVDRLCRADLLLLGNNLVPRDADGPPRCRQRPGRAARARRRALSAVNRSLATAGERVAGLYPPRAPVAC